MPASHSLGLLLVLLAFCGRAAAQSVERIDELNPDGRGTGPDSFVSFGGAFYFAANDASTGREIWKRDSNRLSLVAE